jgi:hypothetical protein
MDESLHQQTKGTVDLHLPAIFAAILPQLLA